MERTAGDSQPLVVTIDSFAKSVPIECPQVRKALDSELASHTNTYCCADTAMLIFPRNHWIRQGYLPRAELFDWYLNQFLPRLKAMDCRNRNGTYFERMIAFQGTVVRKGKTQIETRNQLDHIVNIWHRDRGHHARPRLSALQVAIFDPAKDHTGQPVRGFPCLQQVSFAYDDDGGLAVNAYYPTQYIFDRAYGNYLGLCHLGHFMAHELGLNLVRLTCYIGQPELGKPTKKALQPFVDAIRAILPTGSH